MAIAPPPLIQHITTGYYRDSGIYFINDIGTVADTTGATTSVITLAADCLRVNNYLLARVAVDNSGTSGAAPGLTITDSKSNTWTVGAASLRTPGSTSNDGTAAYIAYAKQTMRLVAGDTITFTWGAGSPAAKGIVVEEWGGIHLATPIATAQSTTTGTSTTPSITKTTSSTIPPDNASGSGQLIYGCLATEGPVADSYTEDPSGTTSNRYSLTRVGAGTTTSAQTVAGAYLMPDTVGTTQSWAPTITSRDWAMVAIVFYAAKSAENKKTTQDFDVMAGDVLVASIMTEKYTSSASATSRGDVRSVTGGGLTWTLRQQQATGNGVNTVAAIYTATVDVDKTMSVIVIVNQDYGQMAWGVDVYNFRGSTGIGASSKTGTTGAPSLAVTTTGDDSALVVANADFNAVDGTSRTWRTPSGSSAAVEELYFRDTHWYTVYGAYHADAGTNGSKTVGLSAPTGQNYSIVVCEVFGTTIPVPHYAGAHVGVKLPTTGVVKYGAAEA